MYKRQAIVFACKELLAGKHHDAFAVDMIQGGAGTTTNMAANEVIDVYKRQGPLRSHTLSIVKETTISFMDVYQVYSSSLLGPPTHCKRIVIQSE